jgi:hypothetical protein
MPLSSLYFLDAYSRSTPDATTTAIPQQQARHYNSITKTAVTSAANATSIGITAATIEAHSKHLDRFILRL